MDGVDRVENTTESGFKPRIGRSIAMDHAAELLGISRRTLYNRIRDGFIQTVRTHGASQRVLVDSLCDELRRQRDAALEKRASRLVRRYS